MNRDKSLSHFPRLDVLDSILEPGVDPTFLSFVEENQSAFLAFVVLGAVECGVTKPRNWIDMQQLLEQSGRRAIESYIDAKLKEVRDEKD